MPAPLTMPAGAPSGPRIAYRQGEALAKGPRARLSRIKTEHGAGDGAERRTYAQLARRIGGQDLAHQERRRPAVHQQMMVADQKTMALLRQPDQRKPQQRRRR